MILGPAAKVVGTSVLCRLRDYQSRGGDRHTQSACRAGLASVNALVSGLLDFVGIFSHSLAQSPFVGIEVAFAPG